MHKSLASYRKKAGLDNDESIAVEISIFETEDGIDLTIEREEATVKGRNKTSVQEEKLLELKGLSGKKLATIYQLVDEWLESESHAAIGDEISKVNGRFERKQQTSFGRSPPEVSETEFNTLTINVGERCVSFKYWTESGPQGIEIPSASAINRGSPKDFQNTVMLNRVLFDFFTNRYSGDASDFGIETPVEVEKTAIDKIEHIFNRFSEVVSQLSDRGKGKPPLTIDDEDDMQYLLHALLRLEFDDIRDETYLKQYASVSPRIDFLIEDDKIGIETKRLSESRSVKKVRTELIEDKEHYASDPDCETLLIFVYDPDRVFPNPVELEKDLSEARNNLTTRVTVSK